MEGRERKGQREDAGGIVSLANAVLQYREAIEYDLLTRTGYTLDNVGGTLSWGALNSFLEHLGADSALVGALNPDAATWSSRLKTNAILADIYDVLAIMNANIVARGSGRPAKRPKPYPRPKQVQTDDSKHFGRGALPVDELHAWFDRKRAEACRK